MTIENESEGYYLMMNKKRTNTNNNNNIGHIPQYWTVVVIISVATLILFDLLFWSRKIK